MNQIDLEELNLPEPNRTLTHIINMDFDGKNVNMYVYADSESLSRCIQLAYISGHPLSVKDVHGNDVDF